MPLDRQATIRALFDEYIEMYASRDDRLTAHFSENFSGYAGSSDALIKDRQTWIEITRQDFHQVKDRIRIEMLDITLQDLSADVVAVTAFFHIHLPMAEDVLSREVARLVLVFRLEGEAWKIVHSGISIPYRQANAGEVYPLASLQERNDELLALVQQRTRELSESRSLYRLLSEDTMDVLWRADARLLITYISPSDERLRGFKAEEVVGHHVFEMFTEEGIALVKQLLKHNAAPVADANSTGFVTFEVQHRCKDGKLLWAQVMSKPERDAEGRIIGFHGISRETTQRHQMEDQIRQLAFYDPLTMLPNRRLLVDRLNQALVSSKRSDLYGAVLFLDLDNFKALNDAHGHAAGDVLLVEVAKRLTSSVRAMDTVSRIGGDEFVVLFREFSLEEDDSHRQVSSIAEKIRARLAEPYYVEIKDAREPARVIEHHCTASIGVVLFRGEEATQEQIFKYADTAMYQAKDAGRNTVRFHTGGPP